MTDLPRNDDGDINTSAEFGESVLVRVTYNTDPDGKWVADDDYSNHTLHGPFANQDEAQAWMDAYPDGDKDLKDMDTLTVNNVRPALIPEGMSHIEAANTLRHPALHLLDAYDEDQADEGVTDIPERLRDVCGCGNEVVWTGEGWQHDTAPYFHGDDHFIDLDDPDPEDPARKHWDIQDGVRES